MKKNNCTPLRLWPLLILMLVSIKGLYSQGFSPATQNRLQQALLQFQNDPAFVGGISAAVKVDGLASWKGATGFAARNVDAQNNLLPGGSTFQTSTLSRIYSITKTFTAPLVLQLANEGVLNLNDPISAYMPYMQAYNPGLNSNVTIRQLLNHESGYSDWEEEIQLQMAIAFDPLHQWTPYELMVFTQQLSAPGTVRRYSHNNYVFLGAIVEAATNTPIEQLYRERFFAPLGLTSLYLEGREAHGSRPSLAAPHDNISPFNPIFQFTGQPTFPAGYTNISAFPFTAITSLSFSGGGLNGDASDIAEWGNALFGGRATSKAVLDSIMQSISATPDEFGNKLGYGVKNTPNISGAYDFIGHNGSAPGYRSVMFYNPERKMTIAVLTNFAGVSAYDIAKALFEALPEFTCGNVNRKESKIKLCYKGNVLCVDRHAANNFIRKGAYLGACEQVPAAKSEQGTFDLTHENVLAFPNPFADKVSLSFTAKEDGRINVLIYDMTGKLASNAYTGVIQKGTLKQI
ncbi:MAG: serine hydrolase, partial [Chitinophagaceae bacterium]